MARAAALALTQRSTWLQHELSRSRAVRKVIAADVPLVLVAPTGRPTPIRSPRGAPDQPLGRELQIAELLRYVKHRRITGTVRLTANVRYTSARHYVPERAVFMDFAPLWEVVGFLAAGHYPARALDATFGPDRVFVRAPDRANVSPMESAQFFGEVDIDGTTVSRPCDCARRAVPCCSARCCGRGSSDSETAAATGPRAVAAADCQWWVLRFFP